MRITNKTIICVCLVAVAVILGIIVYTALKPKVDLEQTASETTETTVTTVSEIPKIEPIETGWTKKTDSVIYDDPRVSVDSSGGVHIDVGGTSDNEHIDEPHISGDVFVIPDIRGGR